MVDQHSRQQTTPITIPSIIGGYEISVYKYDSEAKPQLTIGNHQTLLSKKAKQSEEHEVNVDCFLDAYGMDQR